MGEDKTGDRRFAGLQASINRKSAVKLNLEFKPDLAAPSVLSKSPWRGITRSRTVWEQYRICEGLICVLDAGKLGATEAAAANWS
jgi:hypothetical protein